MPRFDISLPITEFTRAATVFGDVLLPLDGMCQSSESGSASSFTRPMTLCM